MRQSNFDIILYRLSFALEKNQKCDNLTTNSTNTSSIFMLQYCKGVVFDDCLNKLIEISPN